VERETVDFHGRGGGGGGAGDGWREGALYDDVAVCRFWQCRFASDLAGPEAVRLCV
jgi:hypothetical protein